MIYQMVATAVTLNDLEGNSLLADVFKCNPSNICAALYTISADSVLASFVLLHLQSFLSIAQSKNGHNISTDVARRAVPAVQ